MLFSSHNTADVEEICNRIAFIDRGRIIQCAQKHQFLDRWRRLRIAIPAGRELPALESIVDVRRTGREAIAITNAYAADLRGALGAAGAAVTAVEPVTLEEIFLASVARGAQAAT